MSKAQTPLAQRLARVMREMGWSQSDLARVADCSRQTVSSWMHGDNKNMQNAMHAVNIQAASKFNAVWILTGEGPIYITQISPSEKQILDKIRELPEKRKSALELILETDL